MSTQSATDKPNNGHKRGERPTLNPNMALEVLQTAIDYVRGSGLAVMIGNRNGLCVIGITGAVWDYDTQSLCVTPGDDTQTTMTHTVEAIEAKP